MNAMKIAVTVSGVVRDGVISVGDGMPPEGAIVDVTYFTVKSPQPFVDGNGSPATLSPAQYANLEDHNLSVAAAWHLIDAWEAQVASEQAK